LSAEKWKYIEARPAAWDLGGLGDGVQFLPGANYSLHVLDLRPSLASILSGLHKDSVQRRIRHADRAGLVEKCGRSEELVDQFYRLFVVTRKRHQIPPIPHSWFRNLIQCLGSAIEIRMAYKAGIPVAGIVTLRFKDILYFKYGCSDARYNNLGATPWLLWRAIVDAKSAGANSFDLGRTLNSNDGLLAFKNHWVPNPTQLVYWQYPYTSAFELVEDWKLQTANRVFSHMPNWMLKVAGNLAYRHIG
jgi:lipid II:glycine glycyltransferase (peptidoglycan interpeptide bridge formation enzyme)